MYLYNAKLVIKDFQSALFIIGFDGVHFSYVCNCVFILFAIIGMSLSVSISISPAAFGKAFPAEPQSHLYFKWPQKVA